MIGRGGHTSKLGVWLAVTLLEASLSYYTVEIKTHMPIALPASRKISVMKKLTTSLKH